MLGLVGNGHVGMNEPGASAEGRTHRVELANTPWRRRPVTSAAAGPVLPASLLQDHPACTWWLDEAPASRLAAQTT